MAKPVVLLVDDDEEIRSQMKWALRLDYEILQAADRASALEETRQRRPPVVMLDLGLPPKPNSTEEGFQALQEILAENALTKVIVITGQGEKEHALNAIGSGAYDFMTKPIDVDELMVVLRRACYVTHLEREFQDMQSKARGGDFEGMLGASPQMQEIFSFIRKVATTDAPVLLLGESGTGKEMAALAIHHRSRRKDGPFIAINCHAIPETLLEGELFGHEKGAFTGAHAQRIGRVEMANGGTLFLDEIGELPSNLQVKLLRFLQEQRFERVGGRSEIAVDTRIVAATNRDLKQAMTEEKFREDLFFRLAVVVINMPSLRDREGDVALLAHAFLRQFTDQNKRTFAGFTKRALQAMEDYAWPGNVRELENRINRAVIMAEGRQITPADLELKTALAPQQGSSLKAARDTLERDMIKRALSWSKGNISRAATQLDISRPTFYELMEKHGLKDEV